ncbi:MAG TPA: hypothetical protein VL173_18170 [Vicinamibacterales bacterium]|nr:hypothetical protein [Vicinamibacterales bacterium]
MLLVVVVAVTFASTAAAQDLAMINVRIVTGGGMVIPSGTIVIRGGKIASVSAGAASTQGLNTIDAKSMSAMPDEGSAQGWRGGGRQTVIRRAGLQARLWPTAGEGRFDGSMVVAHGGHHHRARSCLGGDVGPRR